MNDGIDSPLNGRRIEIGYISSDSKGLETAIPLLKDIIEPELNAYASKLNYDVEFNFIIDDAQGKTKTHLEKVQGFKSMGINLFIGGGFSSQAEAALRYCNQNDMLMWSPSSSSPLLAIEYDNLYRMCPGDSIQAPVISEMLHSQGIKATVVLQRGDAWADGIYNYFRPMYNESDGNILERIRYRGDDADFSSYLQNTNELMIHAISEYGIDKCGLLVISFDEIVNILKQAQKYPTLYEIPWFGSDGTALSQQIIDKVPNLAAQVTIYSPLASPIESIKFSKLYNKYYALTGQPFGYYNACTYDIAWILAHGILEAQSTEAKDVIPLIPRLTANYFGASGWGLLNEAGDRANSNYSIWGYTLNEESPACSVLGYYDSFTDSIHWDSLTLPIRRTSSDVQTEEIEKQYTNSKPNLVYSLTENLRYIDINFERVFGIPFFKPKSDDIRAVADLNKLCFEETDFVIRMTSISNLFDRVDRKKISKKYKDKYDYEKNSIYLLQEMITEKNPNVSNHVFDELRKIRTLRNIFPVHDSDYSKIKKLAQLGIDGYPFEWEEGWEIILEKTVNLLSKIISMLKSIP